VKALVKSVCYDSLFSLKNCLLVLQGDAKHIIKNYNTIRMPLFFLEKVAASRYQNYF
jgi:hypothetical protein